jgi:hypothetical protein
MQKIKSHIELSRNISVLANVMFKLRKYIAALLSPQEHNFE